MNPLLLLGVLGGGGAAAWWAKKQLDAADAKKKAAAVPPTPLAPSGFSVASGQPYAGVLRVSINFTGAQVLDALKALKLTVLGLDPVPGQAGLYNVTFTPQVSQALMNSTVHRWESVNVAGPNAAPGTLFAPSTQASAKVSGAERDARARGQEQANIALAQHRAMQDAKRKADNHKNGH